MDKKSPIICLYRILRENTDAAHRMTQDELCAALKEVGAECERKAVARNLDKLSECGIEIVRERRGIYLNERKFTDEELLFLIDSVRANRYLCASHTRELVEKLLDEGTPTFRHSPTATETCAIKPKDHDNKQLLYSVSVINDAVNRNRKISFIYNQYDRRKTLVPRRNEKYVVSPYKLFVHNQNYYLMCNKDGCDGIRFFRADFITEIELLERETRRKTDTIEGYDDYTNENLSNAFPYLFTDRIVPVKLLVKPNVLHDVIDRFGTGISIEARGADYLVSLHAAPDALHYWLLQYGLYVTVLEPKCLVDRLREDSATLYQIYHGDKA